MLSWFALLGTAWAAGLPGIPIAFDVAADGSWVVRSEWRGPEATIGAGWRLDAVAGRKFQDGAAVVEVADGEARPVALRFVEPKGKTLVPHEVTVHRAPLVRVRRGHEVPYPAELLAPARWVRSDTAPPVLRDAAGADWVLSASDPPVLTPAPTPRGSATDEPVPTLYWTLAEARWAVDGAAGTVEQGDAGWAAERFANAARLERWAGTPVESLVVPTDDGLVAFSVEWPRGTPSLPTCEADVPETCLASGRILAALRSPNPEVTHLASRHFEIACSAGVLRACFEGLALSDPTSSEPGRACLRGELDQCRGMAAARLASAGADDEMLMHLLEYTCAEESTTPAGTGVDRAEGCMRLAALHDARAMPDLAVLTLDRACVIGRPEACAQAEERHHAALVARIVRECEDEATPLADSCLQLGALLEDESVTQTPLDAFGAFLRSCSLGADEGCRRLGDYVDRWGMDHFRVREAVRTLRQACDGGEARACFGAGQLLVRHDPRSPEYGEALTLFAGGCSQGRSASCIAGAEQRRVGSARKLEAPTQLEMWQAACAQGDPAGCQGLGEEQAERRPTRPAAIDSFAQACELGAPSSCTRLGHLVGDEKEPVPGKPTEAECYTRACTGGDAEGCFALAGIAAPPPTAEEEYRLLEKSCDGDHGPGCAALATVHLDRKTSFDDEIAARHLATACDDGQFESCETLGKMYQTGKGVERDPRKARALREQFQLGAERKYVRVGVKLGLANLAGAEVEGIAPIPRGPALGVAGEFSQIPGAGAALLVLENQESEAKPGYRYLGVTGRLYPNHQARGGYLAFGLQWISTTGVSDADSITRGGWSVRVGNRSDAKLLFSGLEFGLGYFGLVRTDKFIDGGPAIPLLLPVFSVTLGMAPI